MIIPNYESDSDTLVVATRLLDELEDGSKIFVYCGMRPLPRVLMLRLLAALHEYGPCTLLWVEVQDAKHRAGTVETVGDGLLKGYIDRFAPGDNAHDLSLDCWITLCRNALAIKQDGAVGRQAGARLT